MLAAGIGVSITTAVAALPTVLLAFMDAQPGGLNDPSLVRALGDLNTIFFSLTSVMTAVFLAALGWAMLRGDAGTDWLGWLMLVVAAFNCVAVWIGVTFSSYHGHAWLIIGWGAYVGFLDRDADRRRLAARATHGDGAALVAVRSAPRERLPTHGPFVLMATAARSARPARTGGATSARRTRPLSRDYGGDPRSAELADSIGRHQRVISEHEGAMLRDIAEFDRTEAWRGDGSLSMRDWLVAHCHVSRARARTLVESAAKAKDLPALSGALSDGRLTLDVFAPLASVATPETDADLAQASEHWTPKQARQLVSEVKGATDADAAAQFRRRFVRFDDERRLIWAQLTGDSYAVVKSAVLGRARRHDHPSASDPDYVRFESRCADALLEICIEQGRRAAPDPRPPTAEERRSTVAPARR